jgi:hypothetical protein
MVMLEGCSRDVPLFRLVITITCVEPIFVRLIPIMVLVVIVVLVMVMVSVVLGLVVMITIVLHVVGGRIILIILVRTTLYAPTPCPNTR